MSVYREIILLEIEHKHTSHLQDMNDDDMMMTEKKQGELKRTNRLRADPFEP